MKHWPMLKPTKNLAPKNRIKLATFHRSVSQAAKSLRHKFTLPIVAAISIMMPVPASLAQSDDQAAAISSTREPIDSASQTEQHVQSELSALNSQIALSDERVKKLEDEIARLAGDRAQQNAELIAAAQRISLTEIEVIDAEKRLRDLLIDEREIRSRLDSEDSQIASLLSALQRIGKNPPPALIIDPSDAVNAARSASLLSAVLPQMRDRAKSFSDDLNMLVATRQGVETEKSILSSRLETLQEEQLRIAALAEARKVTLGRSETELAKEREIAAQLAAEATSLSDLVDALRTRIGAVDQALSASRRTRSNTTNVAFTPAQVDIAQANTGRTEPALPISSIKGQLTPPTPGLPVIGFNKDDGYGGTSKGEYVLTRGDAPVVTPADGWVIYAGPYLNYDHIIILDAGEDFIILLAGMAQTNVELGQFVLQGEPVGTMASQTFGRAHATNAGISQPTLYIEMRLRNQPLDPSSWWQRDRVAQISDS